MIRWDGDSQYQPYAESATPRINDTCSCMATTRILASMSRCFNYEYLCEFEPKMEIATAIVLGTNLQLIKKN
jgi:hypothetical protein